MGKSGKILMPVIYTKGNIFLINQEVIAFAHGCNCAGSMGKGIAVAFRYKWPKMYQEYKRLCLINKFQLGEVFHWQEESYHIFNLGTQKHWRSKAELNAIKKSIINMVTLAEQQSIKTIALPKIGAGLGGLSWQVVKNTIQPISEQTQITLIVIEEYVENMSPIY